MMRKKFVIFLLLLLFAIILTEIPIALSVSSYVTPLQTVYGSGSCTTCHTSSGGGPRNDYGTLFENQPNHVIDPVTALQNIGAPPSITPLPSPTPTSSAPLPSPIPTSSTPLPQSSQQVPIPGGPIISCYVITGGKISQGSNIPAPVGSPVPISSPVPSSVNKEVQGYYVIQAPQSDWSNLRLDLLTTLALFNVAPLANGDINVGDSDIPADLINLAHNNGVKVIFSFGPTPGDASIIDSILGDPNAKENVINNIFGLIQRNNLDGIDVDVENINPTNSITGESNKVLMTNFVRDLRAKLNTANPNYRINVAIGAYYPQEDQIFDVGVLQNYANYIMMMGYDYHWVTGPRAGSVAPMDNYQVTEYVSIRDGVAHYTSLMDKSKFILGVPYYGLEWPTQDGNVESLTTGRGTYQDYATMKNKAAQYGRIWDDTWKTPWYKYQNGGQWYQGHYDDVESLGIKYDFVNSQNLAGIGIWELGYGNDKPELWQLIQDKFGTK